MSTLILGGSWALALFAACVVACAGVVRGYVGFGFSALCVASLSFVIPMAELVPLVLLLEVCASVILIPSIWPHVNWRYVLMLTASSVISAPLGIIALKVFSADMTRASVLIIICFACAMLYRGYSLSGRQSSIRLIAVGVFAGAVNAVGAVGGLVYGLFLLADGHSPARFRASLAMIFLLVDLFAVSFMYFSGLLTVNHGFTALFLLPILGLGVFAGSQIFIAASPELFKKFVIGLLLVLAITGLTSVGGQIIS